MYPRREHPLVFFQDRLSFFSMPNLTFDRVALSQTMDVAAGIPLITIPLFAQPLKFSLCLFP
jgi:hypothetical protein